MSWTPAAPAVGPRVRGVSQETQGTGRLLAGASEGQRVPPWDRAPSEGRGGIWLDVLSVTHPREQPEQWEFWLRGSELSGSGCGWESPEGAEAPGCRKPRPGQGQAMGQHRPLSSPTQMAAPSPAPQAQPRDQGRQVPPTPHPPAQGSPSLWGKAGAVSPPGLSDQRPALAVMGRKQTADGLKSQCQADP